MGPRVQDMLMLVSRVQDRHGDIRLLLRQDPEVAREVHAYLDDLNWLAQQARMLPKAVADEGGRTRLLATLAGGQRRSRIPRRFRLAVASAATVVVLALSFSTDVVQEVAPGSLSYAMGWVLDAGDTSATPLIPAPVVATMPTPSP